ncbi:MAG TPA: succinate dehydrogenase, cytochrome b556 subunit [Steroidobacteraceae bacterium]|nr:succinate dehydrogenase, cytochrome b556 subunit [Steroidobacteraceae bacterium]
MPARPLSPHLSVYRMYRYSLLSSFLNRLSGVALSLGLLLLVYWLAAVAGGEQAQARAARLLALPLMKLVYAACIIAFCYHLVAGIRHLVWDTGHGLERVQSQRSAWLVFAVSVLLMLLLGTFAFMSAGRAP